MSSILDKKLIKILDERITKGIRTIFLEGASDLPVYKRFFPDAEFFGCDGFGNVIKQVRLCNREFGITEYINGIIDRDDRKPKEIIELYKENIYVLEAMNIECVFLLEEVIINLYGLDFFNNFLMNICNDASRILNKKVSDYNTAIECLLKEYGSKTLIKKMLSILDITFSNNLQRIIFLCERMDETKSWRLARKLMPQI